MGMAITVNDVISHTYAEDIKIHEIPHVHKNWFLG